MYACMEPKMKTPHQASNYDNTDDPEYVVPRVVTSSEIVISRPPDIRLTPMRTYKKETSVPITRPAPRPLCFWLKVLTFAILIAVLGGGAFFGLLTLFYSPDVTESKESPLNVPAIDPKITSSGPLSVSDDFHPDMENNFGILREGYDTDLYKLDKTKVQAEQTHQKEERLRKQKEAIEQHLKSLEPAE